MAQKEKAAPCVRAALENVICWPASDPQDRSAIDLRAQYLIRRFGLAAPTARTVARLAFSNPEARQ
jgi:hypothetical protein